MSEMSDWNDKVIAEFRASGGDTAQFGRDLVVMHTRGAKSGEERLNPVRGFRQGASDGEAWLVVASYAGAPVDPAWAHNLRAHPELDVEVAGAGSVVTIAVRATELPRPERDAAWVGIVAEAPGFADYETKTDRVIPVFRLAPLS